jgi:hypothetical protein
MKFHLKIIITVRIKIDQMLVSVDGNVNANVTPRWGLLYM